MFENMYAPSVANLRFQKIVPTIGSQYQQLHHSTNNCITVPRKARFEDQQGLLLGVAIFLPFPIKKVSQHRKLWQQSLVVYLNGEVLHLAPSISIFFFSFPKVVSQINTSHALMWFSFENLLLIIHLGSEYQTSLVFNGKSETDCQMALVLNGIENPDILSEKRNYGLFRFQMNLDFGHVEFESPLYSTCIYCLIYFFSSDKRLQFNGLYYFLFLLFSN